MLLNSAVGTHDYWTVFPVAESDHCEATIGEQAARVAKTADAEKPGA